MAQTIPDLWWAKEDAQRLYELYLARLLINNRHEQIVAACPRIRRYAACGPGPSAGVFTFFFEIDSLCKLKDYQKAWRRLRLREEILFGKRFDLRHREWSSIDGRELEFSYAPLLYFLGRYRQGCSLLETSLSFWFGGKKTTSFNLLHSIYNEDEEPSHRCRVTLSHFYGRLGRDLRQWQYWERFVVGLHSRLFLLSGIRRDELMADPRRLPEFYEKLMVLRDERTTSGMGSGQSDLTEIAAKVKERQEETQKQHDEFRVRTKPVQELLNRKLRELFPELREIPD